MKKPTESKEQHQKFMALMLMLALLYLYKETVWDPYFYPSANVSQPQVSPQPNKVNAKTEIDDYQENAKSEADFSENSHPSSTLAEQPKGDLSKSPRPYPSDAQIEATGNWQIETDTFTLKISKLGGRITELLLKDYAAEVGHAGTKLNLVEHTEHAPYPLGVTVGQVNDSWVEYRLNNNLLSDGNWPLRIQSGNDTKLVLLGTLESGEQIEKIITFYSGGYFVDVAVKLNRPLKDGARVSLEWTKLIAKDSPSLLDPYNVSGYVWFDGIKALREQFAKLSSDSHDLGDIVWLSVTDKYFMTSLISQNGPTSGKALKTGQLYRARLYGSDTENNVRMFAGPKSYRLLGSLGYELKRNIDFGWTGIIAAPLLSLLYAFYSIFKNYGLAIIALTILVKLALYPLTASSFRQMKAHQDLAPDLKRIRETVTDKQQQQMQMMQLYREKGVNPIGGCLPIFLQMPVFIGLYSALLMAIELRHAKFAFWITDLSGPEKLMLGNFGLPVMVLLFVASMLIQQWTTPSAMDPAQKKAMLIMPLVFGFMFANMPAGLTLYWLTNNLISIGQQAGLKHSDPKHAFRLTLFAAAAVFMLGFVLVLVGG